MENEAQRRTKSDSLLPPGQTSDVRVFLYCFKPPGQGGGFAAALVDGSRPCPTMSRETPARPYIVLLKSVELEIRRDGICSDTPEWEA